MTQPARYCLALVRDVVLLYVVPAMILAFVATTDERANPPPFVLPEPHLGPVIP